MVLAGDLVPVGTVLVTPGVGFVCISLIVTTVLCLPSCHPHVGSNGLPLFKCENNVNNVHTKWPQVFLINLPYNLLYVGRQEESSE